MEDFGYQQDPLRMVSTHSGTVISPSDIVFQKSEREDFLKSPNDIETETLNKLIDVAKSVRALSSNEDFKNLMWYLQQIKSVSELYAYNPTIDHGAKSVWFQQIGLVMGFEGIFNDFMARGPEHYGDILKNHLENIAWQQANAEEGEK